MPLPPANRGAGLSPASHPHRSRQKAGRSPAPRALLLAALAFLAFAPPARCKEANIDETGGAAFVAAIQTAIDANGKPVQATAEDAKKIASTLERRFARAGFKHASATVRPDGKINAQLPGIEPGEFPLKVVEERSVSPELAKKAKMMHNPAAPRPAKDAKQNSDH